MLNSVASGVKEMIINALMIVFVILITSKYVFPCDTELTERESDSYDIICPYGDAVIKFRNGNTDDAQCVNYNPQERMWEFMYADSLKDIIYCREVEFKRYSPSDVRVYTIDGELTVEQAEADLKVNNPLISTKIN